tara:strand:+ start:632 stop:937 length:306 start_codon:yes stop_codon:yes gene_type:complete
VKKLFLLFLTSVLISCSGLNDVGKVMRNEKTTTTDEFLVKKRKPLVLPPDYNEIPEPGTIKRKQNSDDDKIKEILKATEKKENSDKINSSVENSILRQIRK